MSEEIVDGRYRLERQLGHGSMGEVWLGLDLELERPGGRRRNHAPIRLAGDDHGAAADNAAAHHDGCSDTHDNPADHNRINP